jgi:hypothetical protein
MAYTRLDDVTSKTTLILTNTAGVRRPVSRINIIIIIIYLLTAIGLSPGGSGYFTCIKNMKLVTNKFKSGGLHEKHVVATWNVGNRLSVCL